MFVCAEILCKTSLANIETNEKLYNVPLYVIGLLDKFAEKGFEDKGTQALYKLYE